MQMSKQAVYQTLKRGLKKMYNSILKHNLAESPYEALQVMASMLGVYEQAEVDIRTFYKSLPEELQTEI